MRGYKLADLTSTNKFILVQPAQQNVKQSFKYLQSQLYIHANRYLICHVTGRYYKTITASAAVLEVKAADLDKAGRRMASV